MRCPYCEEDNIQGVDLCAACGADLAGLDVPEAAGGFAGHLLTDRLDELSIVPAVTVPRTATVGEGIDRMRSARHGCLVVLDGTQVAGIFTERDVLTRVLLAGVDVDATPIEAVMTPDVFVLSPLDPPAFAIHRMVAQGLRHLPVVDDDGTLLGFVSVRNVLHYIHEEIVAGE